MEAYYQDEWATIYHGDCREVACDVPEIVIVDPPYGIDYQSSRRPACQRKPKIAGDAEPFPVWLFERFRPSVALFVWLRWDVLHELPPPKSLIAWDKGNHSMGDLKHEYGRRWEACAFYPGPEHAFIRRPADVIRVPRVPPARLSHPNEKPAGAIAPLIAVHEGMVLDPFMGSGTTLIAARDVGRKSIGIELEERYCETAANRLRQCVLW